MPAPSVREPLLRYAALLTGRGTRQRWKDSFPQTRAGCGFSAVCGAAAASAGFYLPNCRGGRRHNLRRGLRRDLHDRLDMGRTRCSSWPRRPPRTDRTVVLRDEDGLPSLAVSSHALLAEAADGQHIAVEVISPVMAHRPPTGMPGQAGDESRGQGDAGRGAVFGDCALRGVDVQVALLEALGINAVLGGMDAGIGDGQLGALSFIHVMKRTGDE